MRADPAAVFAAFDELLLRSALDAAVAARLLVVSLRFLAISDTSIDYVEKLSSYHSLLT